MTKRLALSTIVFFATACAATTSDPNTGTIAAAAKPADVSGTWAFVLDASDPAAQFRDQCAKDHPADAAKAAACYAEVREEASHEKLRFTKRDDGTYTFTSFADEGGGREVVFIEAPLALTPDGNGGIQTKLAGTPTGKFAARLKDNPRTMRIEIVDASTIATEDPRKGRLVFTKE